MMLARFVSGSIRRQIAVLAVGPVALLGILGAITEPLTVKVPESVFQAWVVAARMDMALEMVRSAESVEQKAAVLRAVSSTGLKVEDVSAEEMVRPDQEVDVDDFRIKVRENLPPFLRVKLLAGTSTGTLKHVMVVAIDNQRALAFVSPPAVADSWITDRLVNKVLITLAITLPVILLSLYGTRMIASPLSRFSRAARDLDPERGPERPFDEIGSLEVRTLAKSLNDMRSRVHGMIEARTRMLQAISHDLRTPLTRLRFRAERSTEPALRNALLADIDALTFMIEETLIYLKKDITSDSPRRVDLPSIIATTCNGFTDIGHSVDYHGPERFAYPCKPHALQRAVANLIDNGTKFAQHVDVELRVTEDRAVTIRVADNGPGIPMESHADVLEPFFKLDSARGDRGGFGLGLSIVQDIVHAHLGTMTLSNAMPHGLIVEISLPPQSERPAAQSDAAPLS